MFRPTVAIIWFLHSKTIKVVLYNSRDGVLRKRSRHQTPVGTYYRYTGCVGELNHTLCIAVLRSNRGMTSRSLSQHAVT